MQRAAYYVAGGLPLWILRFADDFDFSAPRAMAVECILLAIWLFEIFGFPWKWTKLCGGAVYNWIGYEVNYDLWTFGVSERRASWLADWLAKVLRDRQVLVRDLVKVTGRMQYVYGVLRYDLPFLAPLYAFASRWVPGSCPPLPLFLHIVLSWLREAAGEKGHAGAEGGDLRRRGGAS